MEPNNSRVICPVSRPNVTIRTTQNFLVDFTKNKFLASLSCNSCCHTHALLIQRGSRLRCISQPVPPTSKAAGSQDLEHWCRTSRNRQSKIEHPVYTQS